MVLIQKPILTNIIYFDGNELSKGSYNNLKFEQNGWYEYNNKGRFIKLFENTLDNIKNIKPCCILYDVIDITVTGDITTLKNNRQINDNDRDYESKDYYTNIDYELSLLKENNFINNIKSNDEIDKILEHIKSNPTKKYITPNGEIKLEDYFEFRAADEIRTTVF